MVIRNRQLDSHIQIGEKVRCSVIIPTLNEEKTIGDTIYHIKKQNPFELIVADSHSKDKTVKIATAFGVKVVSCKKKNAAVGRNAGAKIAKGDVLVFLDADTIAFSNLLYEIQKDFEKKTLVGWTCKVFAFSSDFKEHLVYNFFNDIMKFLINRVKKPHASGMILAIRRESFERLKGFNEDLKTMEDHDMAKRLGKIGKFKFSEKTCVFTSTRRISKWGGWKLLKLYSKAYFKYLTQKECVKSYSPVR